MPTLEDVNNSLLEKLNELIKDSSEPGEIVELTSAVAKLNASSRNNDLVATAREDDTQALFSSLAERI